MQQFNHLDMHYGRSHYDPSHPDAEVERRWQQREEERRQRAQVERRGLAGLVAHWLAFRPKLKEPSKACCAEL